MPVCECEDICVHVHACIYICSACKQLPGNQSFDRQISVLGQIFAYQNWRRVVVSGVWGNGSAWTGNCLQVCYMTLIGVHSTIGILWTGPNYCHVTYTCVCVCVCSLLLGNPNFKDTYLVARTSGLGDYKVARVSSRKFHLGGGKHCQLRIGECCCVGGVENTLLWKIFRI